MVEEVYVVVPNPVERCSKDKDTEDDLVNTDVHVQGRGCLPCGISLLLCILSVEYGLKQPR